ncbi:hypothetical protein F6X40_11385 [Paraburkholderia sp. UCT31]|uniref:hypothetical protein n=1 Tax=Paraburkholderia sp. UCT31 TaxID=2615209 RepID=UPI001655597E|nr:hypothetical protein [Paraburkholderia sp. UCT31]MBC8737407.1 hypothetical protein [Paraburkholderia sp. UCT31]
MEQLNIERIKKAAAVSVAAAIWAEANPLPPTHPDKARRLFIAADALDCTNSDPSILAFHSEKDPNEPDAFFLLRHLDLLEVLPKHRRPRYKVRPTDWGVYSRAMRGLHTFLDKGLSDKKLSRLEHADVNGMLAFIQAVAAFMPNDVRAALSPRTDKTHALSDSVA